MGVHILCTKPTSLCGADVLYCTVLYCHDCESLRATLTRVLCVLRAQDPDVLAQKHDPEVHEHLTAAWTDLQNENTTVVGAPTHDPVAAN